MMIVTIMINNIDSYLSSVMQRFPIKGGKSMNSALKLKVKARKCPAVLTSVKTRVDAAANVPLCATVPGR